MAKAPDPVTPPPAGAPANTPEATKPDYLDAAYWDDTTKSVKADALTADLKTLGELKTFKAEYDIRQQGVPADAKEYKLSLEGWTPPEGFDGDVVIQDDHPMAAPAREFALKWKLPQEAFADLVKIQANHVASEAVNFKKQMDAERKLLGEKADERIKSVETAIAGRIGADAAKAISGVLVSANIIQAFESLLRTTGAPGPSAQNGQVKPPADLAQLSPGQKFAFHLAKTSPQPRA